MASGKSGYPSLQPAIVQKLNIGEVTPVGPMTNGVTVVHAQINSGTITTVDGFEPKFEAQVVVADDFIHFYPSGEHARINIKGIAKTAEGSVISFSHTGAVKLNEDVSNVFNMSPKAHTVPFGFATTLHSFESADPKYKFMASESWIGNGRFIVENGKITVETRISLAVSSTVMD